MNFDKRFLLTIKILPLLAVSFLATLLCSCKKAPETGEAFVILKSDEIRSLGDLEVSFYKSDFGTSLKSRIIELKKASLKASKLSPTELIEANDEALKSKLIELGNAKKSLSNLPTNKQNSQLVMSTYASVMTTNARINEMNKNMVSLKLRYKSKHPTMIDAQALLADIKKRYRNEVSAIMQNPSELDFWSEYKLRMKPLEKAMDAPAASPTQQKTAEQAEEKWLAMVQGVLSARMVSLEKKNKNHDEVASRIADIQKSIKLLKSRRNKILELHIDTENINKIKEASTIREALAVDGVSRLMFTEETKAFLKDARFSSTRTGSDGKFKVPTEARYVMASHYRQLTKDRLFWLIEINLGEDQVTLSNSNITYSDDG